MKFRITFKDPDAVSDGIDEAAVASLPQGLPPDEASALADIRHKKLEVFVNDFVSYGEYLVVEFDTDARTATVVPRK
jgi:hypothetical protein